MHFSQHEHALPFFCVYCDLRFRTRAALTMHTPKHSTTKPCVSLSLSLSLSLESRLVDCSVNTASLELHTFCKFLSA